MWVSNSSLQDGYNIGSRGTQSQVFPSRARSWWHAEQCSRSALECSPAKTSPGLQIRALKFQSSSSKFPRARTCELHRARSRLYRSQILQVNTRWKALAEIYTMHSFAPFSNLNFFVKNAESFADFLNRILQNLPDFCWIFAESRSILSKFFRDFPKIQHFSESFRKMLQNRNFPVQRYVCISSRGPLPPLDLELYSRVSQASQQIRRSSLRCRCGRLCLATVTSRFERQS